jgi:hypothetical protein
MISWPRSLAGQDVFTTIGHHGSIIQLCYIERQSLIDRDLQAGAVEVLSVEDAYTRSTA